MKFEDEQFHLRLYSTDEIHVVYFVDLRYVKIDTHPAMDVHRRWYLSYKLHNEPERRIEYLSEENARELLAAFNNMDRRAYDEWFRDGGKWVRT